MSLDDKLQIDPATVESTIIEFIRSTLEDRGIEGLVILYRDYINSLITCKLAISAVGKENVKLIVTQGRFSSRRPTKERDLQTIRKYISLPEDNIVQINIKDLHQNLSKIFLGKKDLIRGFTSSPVLNYNLSYVLLREMARDDFELQKFAPPIKKPKTFTEKEKFTRKTIAHHKSQIRLNMLIGHLLAESENKTLIGNSNKTERSLGLFTKFGSSHAVDMLPLGNLYRTQVVKLSNFLDMDDYLKNKRRDIPTRYKFFFNLTFKDVDRILIRLEEGISEDDIAQETNLPLKAIKRINFHYIGSKYARTVPLVPKF